MVHNDMVGYTALTVLYGSAVDGKILIVGAITDCPPDKVPIDALLFASPE